MTAHPNNPYQDNEGNPKPGELRLFLDWERDYELMRRKELPPEQVAELEKADSHLAAKMNS
ncbi:hypothetical protein Q765_00290 [Flavobacterium rivuli WB 3.3-2 = DSM 21788]|uniref:Uncharacterized protein n=1 Tax=Flavobacterium rivuli WB 3.3-2 = DSM 21788 TaxID=1121895 RepID=A0A0A2MJ79_9FLAO|nr:hypothetical protein [Flavobacterium rivuli]KGO88390.1 hypothetical protein Q765_00290 [Flavobacterium rivuli WB 3.3-2 = DSM 21788]